MTREPAYRFPDDPVLGRFEHCPERRRQVNWRALSWIAVGLLAMGVAATPSAEALTPSDPDFSLQWAYPTIEATRAWDIQLGSQSVVLAIIDTGLDFNHPDLQNRWWVNPGEIPANGLDDDGNGFVDDVRGWDFVNSDNDPQDDHLICDNGACEPFGAGTFVSGIAGATIDNGIGVAGTAQVSIMVLKAGNQFGAVSVVHVRNALDYAKLKGAKIVSMSFGGPSCGEPLDQKLAELWTAGIVLIASTGNSNANAIECPASHANVIPVGATTSADVRWVDSPSVGSNFGTHLKDNGLVAPGKSIHSTLRVPAGTYGPFTGTSASAPFVAGVAGLILSQNPALSHVQVKTILRQSADDLGDPGSDIYHGAGRLNALRAVLGADDRPYAKITNPTGGETFPPGSVSVTGYVRKSALNPKTITEVWVDISNKGCGVFPDWRQAELVGENWSISYATLSYPNCDYTVLAKAWDGSKWSNLWSVPIRIQANPPPPI